MEVRAALRLRWLYRIGLLCFTVGLAVVYLPVWHGDAAIYLPYVRSLAQGRWMEFNPGEPSSGATSPLWVLLLLPGWLALGVDGFKLTGAFWTLVAVLAAYEVALRHSFCAHTAVLVALTTAVCCIPWGFLGYETPLAALAGMLALRLHRLPRTALFVAAALLPLVRPELWLVLCAALVAMALRRRTSETLLAAAALLLPAAYSALMHVLTGSFSSSGYCRALALREFAQLRLGFLAFNGQFLLQLVQSGLLWLLLALPLGIARLWRQDPPRALATTLGAGAVVGFFTIVAPPNMLRYLAPVAFALGWLGKNGLASLRLLERQRLRQGAFVLLAAVMSLFLLAHGWRDLQRGYAFELITERECAERLNTLAEPGAIVLAYEVQIRYWLRPDLKVLSLDGVTDGKIAPYAEPARVAEFLRAYRPRYWVANIAVERRPFLASSVLERALRSTSPQQPIYEKEGIRFELLERFDPQRLPRGFYGCTALYRLSYSDPPPTSSP